MTARRALILLVAGWLVVLATVVAHDASVPREREWSTGALVAAIGEYREHISPRLKGRVQCRFVPTCSAYGLASVQKHGALRGGARAVGRVFRCGPWTPLGTIDPP